jgi:hypothetical protein
MTLTRRVFNGLALALGAAGGIAANVIATHRTLTADCTSVRVDSGANVCAPQSSVGAQRRPSVP